MEIVVVGAGVIGLTSAICVQEALKRALPHAQPVRLLVRDGSVFDTTSARAGAVWWPFVAEPLESIVRWSRSSLDYYKRLAAQDESAGVSFVDLVELFPPLPATPPPPAWADESFRFATPSELAAYQPLSYGTGHCMRVPVVDSRRFLPYLLRRFLAAGGVVERLAPHGVANVAMLTSAHRLVINCTGLGAKQFACDDAVHPVRGQILVLPNTNAITTVRFDEHPQGPLSLAYVIPRSNDIVIGGTVQPDDACTQADPQTAVQLLHKAGQLDRSLAAACAKLAASCDGDALQRMSAVGLRPGRRGGVRLQLEASPAGCDGSVLHNYGHGGSGFTVCWGCAADVAELALRWAHDDALASSSAAATRARL